MHTKVKIVKILKSEKVGDGVILCGSTNTNSMLKWSLETQVHLKYIADSAVK